MQKTLDDLQNPDIVDNLSIPKNHSQHWSSVMGFVEVVSSTPCLKDTSPSNSVVIGLCPNTNVHTPSSTSDLVCAIVPLLLHFQSQSNSQCCRLTILRILLVSLCLFPIDFHRMMCYVRIPPDFWLHHRLYVRYWSNVYVHRIILGPLGAQINTTICESSKIHVSIIVSSSGYSNLFYMPVFTNNKTVPHRVFEESRRLPDVNGVSHQSVHSLFQTERVHQSTISECNWRLLLSVY